MNDATLEKPGPSSRDEPAAGIDWYFDIISPFAYLALGRVEALAKRRRVTMRPIVFGALLKHWGQLGPAEIPAKRMHTYRLCVFLAEKSGQAFRFPPIHPFRSLDAMRLLAGYDCDATMVRGAFDFVWAEGRDPSDPAEFARLRERLGVGGTDPEAVATAAKTRLRTETDDAIARGVFGVPTLAVDGELFWGVDAMDMAERFLDDPAFITRGEMARLTGIPFGVARRA